MVGALSVVEDEPIGEFAVEEGEVGEEQVLVVVHEGLLDRPVEARVWRSSSILGYARVAEPWANASSIVSCAKSVAFGEHTLTQSKPCPDWQWCPAAKGSRKHA
jgi:hypothetical protein